MVISLLQLDVYAVVCSLVIIDGNAAAEDVLTDDERDEFDRLRFEKKRVERLHGRLAAKEAVISLLKTPTCEFGFEDLEIFNRPGGAPFLKTDGRERKDISVSISHSNEVAVAAASDAALVGLGIDVEIVEARGDPFLRTAFTEEERKRWEVSSKEVATELYTLKEAVSKALGVGFAVNTHDIEVLGGEGEAVRLHGEAKRRSMISRTKRFYLKSFPLNRVPGFGDAAGDIEKDYVLSLAAVGRKERRYNAA